MPNNRINAYIAAGEGAREKALRQAIYVDKRFEPLQVATELPVDLRFHLDTEDWNDLLDIELKLPQDFVQSVLSGHLMEQTLSIREGGNNGCTVILGSLDEIYEAIRASATGRGVKKAEMGHVIATTHARCKSFRKRSFLNGVPIFHKGDDSGFFDSDDQWKDILELAHDYLCDGDLLGFRQRPAENEREVCAAATLFRGIGPEVMRTLLQDYQLCFAPRNGYARPIEEIPGIGPKRAQAINPHVRMTYLDRVKA